MDRSLTRVLWSPAGQGGGRVPEGGPEVLPYPIGRRTTEVRQGHVVGGRIVSLYWDERRLGSTSFPSVLLELRSVQRKREPDSTWVVPVSLESEATVEDRKTTLSPTST